MAIITTFVCDVSGVQSSEKTNFVEVKISAEGYYTSGTNTYVDQETRKTTTKLVHKDVANKLGIILPKKGVEAQPEPTLESKLLVLLKEYITDIAYEAGGEAGAEAASNRG